MEALPARVKIPGLHSEEQFGQVTTNSFHKDSCYKKTDQYQGEGHGGRDNLEFEIDMYTLLYLKTINNKDLLLNKQTKKKK